MFFQKQAMESISTDSLNSGGVKENYVELSSLVFEELSLKSNRHFIHVKILASDHKERTRTVIQECLRMNMIINKTFI